MCYRYEGQVYGCASQEFLNWFAASPQAYLEAVQQQALLLPACIGLLELQPAFPELSLDDFIASVPLQTLQVMMLCTLSLQHKSAKHTCAPHEDCCHYVSSFLSR